MPNLPVSMGVRANAGTHLEEFMPQCRQDISKMLMALLREQRCSQATVARGVISVRGRIQALNFACQKLTKNFKSGHLQWPPLANQSSIHVYEERCSVLGAVEERKARTRVTHSPTHRVHTRPTQAQYKGN